jgi:hypothetical protein
VIQERDTGLTLSQSQIAKAMAQPDKDFDEEMDDPRYHQPEVVAGMAIMKERYLRSSNQNIEEALRQYETNYNDPRTRRKRWGGQKRWMGKENEEMRVVRIMHPYTFLRRLQAVGIDARVEEHKNARMWLNNFTRVGRIGINARIAGEAQTVTTLQYPYAPEYSVMRFDEYDVPREEKYRGWRTTLLALIFAEVITEKEATEAFGPAVGPASEFYREQLQINRRIRMGLQI